MKTVQNVEAAGLNRPNPLIDISIIIVSWNTADLLRACMASIVETTTSIRYEIIVVDNASHDGSPEMVAREYPDVQLLVNARNMGFAVASNQGLRLARGRYLVLLNSDTLVFPGAFAAMVQYMEAHERVGALGPRLLNADRSLQESAFPFPDIMRDVAETLRSRACGVLRVLPWGRSQQSVDAGAAVARAGRVDWVYGACLLVRRAALEQVGLLDEGYFFGNEEVDLCLRLRKRGWSVVYLSDVDVVHLGAQSWIHMSPTRIIWFYTGRLRYFRLHYTLWERLLQRIAIAMVALAHIVSLLARHKRSRDENLRLSAFAYVLARAVTD